MDRIAEFKRRFPGTTVHESAYVDNNVEIGEGTRVCNFSLLLPGARVGRNCIIGHNVMIEPDVKIGDRFCPSTARVTNLRHPATSKPSEHFHEAHSVR